MKVRLPALLAFSAMLVLFAYALTANAESDRVLITNFRSHDLVNGVPQGWNLELRHGAPNLSLEKVDVGGVLISERETGAAVENGFCLHLHSDSKSSFGISRKMSIDPKEYPWLTWKWAASCLPDGGDIRKRATDDEAAQLYVVFTPTGIPHSLTAPLLGYIWDNNCPKGATGKSTHLLAGRVRYIVLRNKSDKLGQWVTEKRNIYEDYKLLFKDIHGGEPPMVVGVTFFTNAHNTKTRAESWFCDAYFTKN